MMEQLGITWGSLLTAVSFLIGVGSAIMKIGAMIRHTELAMIRKQEEAAKDAAESRAKVYARIEVGFKDVAATYVRKDVFDERMDRISHELDEMSVIVRTAVENTQVVPVPPQRRPRRLAAKS